MPPNPVPTDAETIDARCRPSDASGTPPARGSGQRRAASPQALRPEAVKRGVDSPLAAGAFLEESSARSS